MLFAPNQMCDSPPFSLRTEEASRMKLKDVPSLSFQAPWTPVSERCSRTWETWDQETFLHLLLSSVVNLCELQHQVPVLSWQEWPPAWAQLLHKPDRWPCGKIPADQQFQKHSRFSLLSPSSFWCSVWRPCSILLTELCSVLVRRCNYSWCSHVSRVCMKSDRLSEFGVFVGQTFAKVTLMKSASDQDESFVLTDGLTRVSLSFGAFSIKMNSAVLMQWAVKVILNWGCLVSQNQCRVKGLLTMWVLQPSVAPRSLNILKSFLKAMKVFWFQLQESCVRSSHKGQKYFKSSHVSPPNHKVWVLIESQVRLMGLFFSSQLLEASLPRSFCHEGAASIHMLAARASFL